MKNSSELLKHVCTFGQMFFHLLLSLPICLIPSVEYTRFIESALFCSKYVSMSYYFESFSNLFLFSCNVFFNNCQIKRYHLISGWGWIRSSSVIETYLRCNTFTTIFWYFRRKFRPRRKFRNFTNNYRCRSQIVRLLLRFVASLLPCPVQLRSQSNACHEWMSLNEHTRKDAKRWRRRPTFPVFYFCTPWAFTQIVVPSSCLRISFLSSTSYHPVLCTTEW